MTQREKQRRELLKRLRSLADGKINDSVKLLFLKEEDREQLDGLELRGLVELKRSDKGVEMKFVDPIRAIGMMRELMEERDEQGAQSFFDALNQAADGVDEN